ncbi:MAG TPA: hypothetical protein VIK89_04975 [Cytophagaceae bacterium]
MLRAQQYQIIIIMLLVLVTLTGCQVLGQYFQLEAIIGAIGSGTVIGIIIYIYKHLV